MEAMEAFHDPIHPLPRFHDVSTVRVVTNGTVPQVLGRSRYPNCLEEGKAGVGATSMGKV
jgi:hypothetical protein